MEDTLSNGKHQFTSNVVLIIILTSSPRRRELQMEGMTKTAHAEYHILRVNVVIIFKTYIALKSQAPSSKTHQNRIIIHFQEPKRGYSQHQSQDH